MKEYQNLCYEPENEMVVRHFVNQLETDQFLDRHLIVCNLYKIFLSICDDMDITDAIPDMEEADGSAYLLSSLIPQSVTESSLIKSSMSHTNRVMC